MVKMTNVYIYIYGIKISSRSPIRKKSLKMLLEGNNEETNVEKHWSTAIWKTWEPDLIVLAFVPLKKQY